MSLKSMEKINSGGDKRAKRGVRRDVPAVARAIKILRFLAKNSEPIGVVPLARALQMIPSTCLHIVRVLCDNGMVTFDAKTKRYTLGAGVLAFSTAYSVSNPFPRVARQHFQTLSRAHDSAFAAIEQSGPDHYIVAAATDPAPGLSIRLSVGSRFPILVSAAGSCFAAFGNMAPQQLKDGFAKLRWDKPPTFSQWLKNVEATRTSGCAVDSGDYMRGITVVAVPARNEEGRLRGCICAIGLREQISGAALNRLVDSLRTTTLLISRDLGHGTSNSDPEPRRGPVSGRPRRRNAQG
jgi:DNA-binding IclR family transcriptional regulator